MVWTGTFFRNGSDMFRAVDGYFGTQGFGIGGPVYPVQIDTESTPGRLILQSSTQGLGLPLFLGEVIFTGTGLQVQNVAVPGGTGTIPRLVAGTITRIEVHFNTDLDDLLTALSLATTAAERDRINALIPSVATEAHMRSLPANAVIEVGAIAAAALGTAVLASYQAHDDTPLRAYLSQFNHIYTALNGGTDLYGFDNDDVLIGGPGLSNIYGGGGDDTISGGAAGPNGLNGQGGADFYLMGAGADRVADDGTDAGLDIVSYQNATAGVVVDMENTGMVQMTGWAAGDAFGGVEGVIGSAFDDVLIGRTTVWGPQSSDLLQGGAGNDTLIGGEGSDTLIGGAGFDVIDGGGNQSQVGGTGPGDRVVYEAGPNEVHFFAAQNGLVVVTPDGGVDFVTNVELFSFAGQVFGLNQLQLSNANLRIGDDRGDALDGTAGIDLLFGAAGNDAIAGAGGNDLLDGGAGTDRVAGDAGNDTLHGGDGGDTLLGGDGDDVLLGGDSSLDLRDVIYGGAGDDSIDGGYGNDDLRGEGGNDTIEGGFGSDTLIGGTGNDTLSGSSLGDLLLGGDGADYLNGGFGFDRVNGGAGADRFFHLGVTGHGTDWIADYHSAEGDRLVFGVSGATAAQFQINWANTPNAGEAGVQEAFVIYRPTGQIIWALVDGGANDHIRVQAGASSFDLLA